jgi:hypothetical protein
MDILKQIVLDIRATDPDSTFADQIQSFIDANPISPVMSVTVTPVAGVPTTVAFVSATELTVTVAGVATKFVPAV